MECEGEETLGFLFLREEEVYFHCYLRKLITSLMLKVVARRFNKTDISRYSKDHKHRLVRTRILLYY